MLADVHRITADTLAHVQEYLATDTTTPLVVEAHHDDLAGGTVWGLLRTAQTENPDRIILVDTDHHPASQEALPALVASGQPQARIRNGVITIPRLTRTPADHQTPTGQPADLSQGTILITGGTGSLGSLIARHLVTTHGARDLVLVSRSGPDADNAAELTTELEEHGARVRVIACDITDHDALTRLIDHIGPLTGVIHTAAALADTTFDRLDTHGLTTTLAPKADPAWWLHQLTRHHDLALFVVFSSAAAVLGSPGQANYAAANSFLDTLATHRRTQGLPATSLAWGWWQRTSGMTRHLTQTDHDRMTRTGIRPLTDQQGLELFDTALAGDSGNVVTATFDLPTISRSGAIPPYCCKGSSARRVGRRSG
ncbi:SDR family NAD(P)-dependent oxidoreductase [Streptomyces sp. GMY02]|nr:SDR family NAD(P)-dependent oxidoreductase [Streptomyces sp. GMY02]